MFFYYGILISTTFLSIVTAYGKTKFSRKQSVIVPFVLLFIIMAFRDISVGVDTAPYGRIFLKISQESDWINVVNAPVYTIFAKVISILGGNYRILLILSAAFCLFAVAKFIYKFSLNVTASIYCFISLYFYFFAFNGTRQFLAMALLLLGICARENKQWVLTVLLALLSIGTHSTALVVVPFLIFSPKKFCKVMLRNTILASIIFVIVFNLLYVKIINWFVFIFPRYNWYLGENIRSVFDKSQGDIIYLNLFYLFIVLGALIVFSGKRLVLYTESPEQNHLRYFAAMLAVGTALGLAGGSFLSIARVAYYFQLYVICLIPNLIEQSGKYKVLLYVVAFCILLIPFTISLLRNFNGIIPYIMSLSS